MYLLACGIGILGVERLGRRKLLLASLAGVVVSLLVIGVMFQRADSTSPDVIAAGSNCPDRHQITFKFSKLNLYAEVTTSLGFKCNN